MKGDKYAQILTKIPGSAIFLNIMRDIRRNVLPKLYRALYGVMLVSIRMTTNMTTGNQQKHLLLRFDMKASFIS